MGDELREQVSSLGGRGVAAWRWRRLRNTAGCCTQLPCAQLPCLLPHMQAIDKFKLCYVRYQALLAQLHAEAGVSPAAAPLPGGGANSHSHGTLLQHLLAGYAGEGAGDGDSCLLYSGGFEGSFCREVQRLRLFIKSSLEQLWLALLDACAHLREHGEELLQAGAAAAGPPKQRMDARLAALKAEFDSTAAELVLVERFVQQNVGACAQLAQMYDRQAAAAAAAGQLGSPPAGHRSGGSGVRELALEEVDGSYVAALQAALLGELRVEPLVVGLSDAYELCRQAAACCGCGCGCRAGGAQEGTASPGAGCHCRRGL